MPIELQLKKWIVREVYGVTDVREYFVSRGKKPRGGGGGRGGRTTPETTEIWTHLLLS